jgi:hypothetical protein
MDPSEAPIRRKGTWPHSSNIGWFGYVSLGKVRLVSFIGSLPHFPTGLNKSPVEQNVICNSDSSTKMTENFQLMSILAAMIGSPRVYPVQFNENAAW